MPLPIIAATILGLLKAYVLKMLVAYTGQKGFEFLLHKLLEFGAKSTKTDWDDKLVKKHTQIMDEHNKKIK